MKTVRAQRKISHACRMLCFVDGKTFPAYMHLFHANDKTSDLRAPLYVMIDLEVAFMSSMGADFPKPRQILFLVMPFKIEMTKTSSWLYALWLRWLFYCHWMWNKSAILSDRAIRSHTNWKIISSTLAGNENRKAARRKSRIYQDIRTIEYSKAIAVKVS